MPAPLVVGAAAAAARLLARKMAKDSAKKSVKKAVKTAKKSKPLAEPKSAVKIKYNKQAMENAIKKENAPKGPSAMAVRAREIERKIAENNKRFGVGQSRPATKAETSATTAKYKANTARTMSSDKVAKNSVKVKPAAKQKPNKPNPSKMEYKFGMGINRARAKGNDVLLTNPGRKNRIQADKYKKSK
jgi:Tfp pilus assembly protein PilE